MAAAAEETARVFGPVHLLCNNVGVSQRNPIDEASYEDWDYVLDVNIGRTVGRFWQADCVIWEYSVTKPPVIPAKAGTQLPPCRQTAPAEP